ncbi:general transcription factor IIF subunit 2 isoform X2 [Cucumis melo var. makuwa]|uniref:General transcription factor IIF subunit 2 isoform X2 n=1 Tax=Cucumis melo var. makuwa TaxID=1194695 RepID=A0A5A7TGB8_CUCMM|nr:general transcription factor IIF subunit 2 isoform X2 [Cucumis melo var. makuwa]
MDVDGKSIDRSTSRKHQTNNNNIVVGTDFLETNKADRAMWLLKCPQVVTRALSNSPDAPSRPVAKVIVSVDPLQSNDDDDSSSTEVYDYLLLWCFWFSIEASLLIAFCDVSYLLLHAFHFRWGVMDGKSGSRSVQLGISS